VAFQEIAGVQYFKEKLIASSPVFSGGTLRFSIVGVSIGANPNFSNTERTVFMMKLRFIITSSEVPDATWQRLTFLAVPRFTLHNPHKAYYPAALKRTTNYDLLTANT
jgi:hypothetical protein